MDLDLSVPPKPTTPCILWHKSVNSSGYGQQWVNGKNEKAHRVAYVAAYGPIPAETPHIDHLCCVLACVRPDHLEAVTQAENNRRQAARSTHCRKGLHRWDEQEPAIQHGRRTCRPCLDERQRRRVAA